MRRIACILLLGYAPSAVGQASEAPVVPRDSAVVVVHDPVRAALYTFAVGQAWHFALGTDVWKPLGSLRLPSDVTNAAYDARAKRIVFWNRGVGDVYAWEPGDSALMRLDRSFPHQAQFDHAAAMDAGSGRIYAVGGYGLWTYKDHVTSFDLDTGEWGLVPLTSGSTRPAPRREATATVWRDGLYLLGGRTLPDVRTDVSLDGRERPAVDLWRLDLARSRWRHVGDVGGEYPNGLSVGLRERATLNVAAVGALDPANGLWYVLNHGGVVAIDLRTGAGQTLVERTSAPAAVGIAFDAPRRRLVVVERRWTHLSMGLPLQVRIVPAPGPAVLREMETAGSRPWTWGVGGLLAAAMLWSAVHWRKGGHRSTLSHKAEPSTTHRLDDVQPPLTVMVGDDPRILIYARDETAGFPSLALKLLTLLADARLSGREHVPVAEIDHALWSTLDAESQRKRRHELLQSLNSHRSTMQGGSEPWVTSRQSPDDRRRRDLSLSSTVNIVRKDAGRIGLPGVSTKGVTGDFSGVK